MRRLDFKILAAAIVFTLANFPVVILGVTICDDTPDSDYVALGNDPAFTSVGTFSANLTGCGILIASDWVLTAAHLILGGNASGTFTLNGTAYSSTQIIKYPSWDGNASDGNDFALVQLNSSLAVVTPTLYTGSISLGQTATFVGYGLTGNGLTGYTTLDGQKRGFQDVVDVNNPYFGNTNMVFGATFESPANGALSLEGCVAPGDSGGGVFVNDGSQYDLAGVISFEDSTNGAPRSVYGNISGFDSILPAMSWITSTVPEPTTVAITTVPSLIFLLKKNRRRPF